jgi:hypothetical protein
MDGRKEAHAAQEAQKERWRRISRRDALRRVAVGTTAANFAKKGEGGGGAG